jgi:hypothetical protein
MYRADDRIVKPVSAAKLSRGVWLSPDPQGPMARARARTRREQMSDRRIEEDFPLCDQRVGIGVPLR